MYNYVRLTQSRGNELFEHQLINYNLLFCSNKNELKNFDQRGNAL